MADGAALRAAAKSYIREARDADELIAFAMKSSREAERDEYLDGGLAALRRCAEALRQIVALLPSNAIAGEKARALREQTDSLTSLGR